MTAKHLEEMEGLILATVFALVNNICGFSDVELFIIGETKQQFLAWICNLQVDLNL